MSAEERTVDVDPGGSVTLHGTALAEFESFAASAIDLAHRWNELRDSFERYLPDETAGEELARYVADCVDAGRPSSLIRLGDGEGNVLALGLDRYPALAGACARGAAMLHLAKPDAFEGAGGEIVPAMHDALRSADVIGFPGPFALGYLLRSPENPRPIYGVAAVLQYLLDHRADLGLATKIGLRAGFHHELLPYYRRLVEGRRVGLVGCHHSLAESLRTGMGATEVVFHEVPPQAILREGARADTGHYPARYRELLGELRDVEPGTLYLVAAGMFGKVYCGVLREAGAIALDVGSAADVWAGVKSRLRTTSATLRKWQLDP